MYISSIINYCLGTTPSFSSPLLQPCECLYLCEQRCAISITRIWWGPQWVVRCRLPLEVVLSSIAHGGP